MPTSADGLPMGFLTDPSSIIAAWEGGMSFHGGLLGVVIAVWLFCRRQQTEFAADRRSGLRLRADRPVLRALANFVNGELWGRVTDVPWAMVFPARPATAAAPSQPVVRSGDWKACCCS